MTLAGAEHLAVTFAAVVFTTACVAVVFVAARARRRWRSRRGVLSWFVERHRPRQRAQLSRTVGALAGTVGSPSWWLVQRDCHRMWRSVAGAQRAVSLAVRADAPVGDLPALTRQLQRAATGVDAALRASGGDRRLAGDAARERARIQSAADDVRAAAVESLATARGEVQPVVSAVAVEVAALAEGLRSARAAQY